MNLWLLLLGYRTVRTDTAHATALLNLCMEREYSYVGFADDGDGISFRCTLCTARKLKKALAERGIPLTVTGEGGLPISLWARRGRVGLLLGGLCAIVLTVLSGRFVWDVRVTGNTIMTAGEVREELARGGLEIGTVITGLDTGAIENRVLLSSDRLAWISVHLDGTVAMVQVIERTEKPETVKKPANLVASCDGQIESIELFRGNCLVGIGQPVRAGELLVSGVYDSETAGLRWTRAAGRIMARTERTIHIEIPYAYEEKQYTDTKLGDVTLHFFKFSAKIFKKAGNDAEQCDIIETVEGLERFGLRSLPVFLTRQTCRFYETVPAERTPEEALELAYRQLSEELATLSSDTQLLGKRIGTTLTESALILDCTVDCIENIAVQHEFEFDFS